MLEHIYTIGVYIHRWSISFVVESDESLEMSENSDAPELVNQTNDVKSENRALHMGEVTAV